MYCILTKKDKYDIKNQGVNIMQSNEQKLFNTNYISTLSIGSWEFILNLDEILNNKTNPLNYRYKYKGVKNVFDCKQIQLKVLDTKTNKMMLISFNDYMVLTKNPCISQETFNQIMNYRHKGYALAYSFFLQRKYVMTFKKIKKNGLKIELEELIKMLKDRLKISKLNFDSKGKTINDFIKYLKSYEFLQLIRNCKEFKRFTDYIKFISDKFIYKLQDITDAETINENGLTNDSFAERKNRFVEEAKEELELRKITKQERRRSPYREME